MELPETGREASELQTELEARRAGDADWREGRTWSLVYHGGEDLEAVRDDAYERFAAENALNPLAFPSVLGFENEVVGMVAEMMHGETAVGNVTSGGTESIFLATYTARERARRRGPDLQNPTVVYPETAHPAWAKAAHYLDMDTVVTPTDEAWRADPEAMAEAVTDDTVLLVASAPSYPHGVVDPVEDVAAIAADHGIPCHVDACIGGFVLPFLDELGAGHEIPPYDFSVPGVTSMSVDPHKYGYTAKGVSVLLHRDKSHRRDQYYADDDWPGGIYVAPNVQGTRPAGPIAAAWAVMKFVGRDGYHTLVEEAMDATETIADAIAEMNALAVVGDPDMTLLGIESVDPDVSAWTVQRELSERGWELERQQRPESMHLSVMAQHAPVVDEFLADLEACVAIARAADTEEATAPLYGLSASFEEGEDATETVIDLLNEVFVS
jgi:glutamate/tyrosine decarboxylase-like PLP-dependent enzyme